MIGSVLGMLHLIVSIWAIVNVVQSRESTGSKVLWTAGIIFFPVIGLLIWLFAGPRKS
ncbi:MAG: PLD nuclease N-terminal domain-containing protein [Gemmatimonadetes bacterium]|nr:PLD nuclease N-terminal domain-containing protein [Gemmatimonadota bacterium]